MAVASGTRLFVAVAEDAAVCWSKNTHGVRTSPHQIGGESEARRRGGGYRQGSGSCRGERPVPQPGEPSPMEFTPVTR